MVFDTAGGELPDGARVVSIAAEAPGATYFIVEPNGEQLRELSQLAEAGYVEPVIDSVFPLTHVQAEVPLAEGPETTAGHGAGGASHRGHRRWTRRWAVPTSKRGRRSC
jgi:hypothetical protein